MKKRSLERGRRKAVDKFAWHHGFWMLAMASAFFLGILLLYLLGYLHLNVD
jgi:hypothetical protein